MRHSVSSIRWRLLLATALLLLPATGSFAQRLQGIVSDAENGQPLESVLVSVLRDGKVIDYTLTDGQGHYSLSWLRTDTLQVSASLLGYRRTTQTVGKAGTLHFRMKSESIQLHEVEIKSNRVYGRKDTIRYDLTRFAEESDRRLKDVLKRLPGIDVEENGRVNYKGKPIDHLLVEGMDLTGGRYNQLTNNLNAKAVKTAEIMENYQSRKALQGRINSEEVALNLKIDTKSRGHWLVNGTAAGGWTAQDEAIWEAVLNGLLLERAKQTLVSYKGNNTGHELNSEQQQLAGTQEDVTPECLLKQPGISTPLALHRVLLNETHTANLNRMIKRPGDRSLRLQAGYTHDERQQTRSTSTLYYQGTDTIGQQEAYHHRSISDAAHAELFYEVNSEQYYLKNRFGIEGNQERSRAAEVAQRIHTHTLNVHNHFDWLRSRDRATWEVKSALQYSLLPATLHVGDWSARYRQQQFYTDNSLTYLHKYNGLTQHYTMGLAGEQMHYTAPQRHTTSQGSLYVKPGVEWEHDQWFVNLQAPLKVRRYFNLHGTRLLYQTTLYVRLRPDHHWEYSLFGNLQRSADEGISLYPASYRSDYRTWHSHPSRLIPVSDHRYIQLYGEYKNTIQEFFVTLKVSYEHQRRNTLTELYLTTDSLRYDLYRLTNSAEQYHLRSTLSKGIYEWKMRAGMELDLLRSNGLQRTNGENQHYRFDNLTLRPKLTWLPTTWMEAEYSATLNYGGTHIRGGQQLDPLLHVNQQLRMSFKEKGFELHLTGEHYRNELDNQTRKHTLFADASASYRNRKGRFEIGVSNLFNQKEYTYTRYAETHSTTSRIGIRPREYYLKIDWQF